ncbi:hypothetical protein SCUCBS95973_008140 [Sporothrix curviconia]|uniref:Cell cycle control protein n=1 Tax=Sporothrix curviconia TaxID=1260050 RepID=A0ABP0CIZ8_9PEZI
MPRQERAEPDVIDLTEEPDSPVLLSHSIPHAASFRTAARSAARSARQSVGPSSSRQQQSSSAVIDLTGDDDGVDIGSDSFARRMERQRRHDAFTRHLVNEMRDQQRQPESMSASRSIFSAFSIGNIAHLTSLALGAATGSGSGSSGNNNSNNTNSSNNNGEHSSGRRGQSAHRQNRNYARAHNHRMQQAQHVADRHYLGLAEAQFAMALSRNRRRGGGGDGGGGGGGGGGGYGSGHMFDDFDELQMLQAAGLDPLGENAPHLDYQQNGGFVFTGFAPAEVWRSAGNGNGSGGGLGGPGGAQYEAPGTPLPGYTRETGEDLVAICASCDRELAYDPDEGEGDGTGADGQPPAKRTRKSAKETAQHHFWAVRNCGHVYCRACYENRRNGIKKDTGSSRVQHGSGSSGGGGSGSSAAPSVMFQVDGKVIYCAAEGCQSDVTAKNKWQGLFV